jgi:hypothetical protein
VLDPAQGSKCWIRPKGPSVGSGPTAKCCIRPKGPSVGSGPTAKCRIRSSAKCGSTITQLRLGQSSTRPNPGYYLKRSLLSLNKNVECQAAAFKLANYGEKLPCKPILAILCIGEHFQHISSMTVRACRGTCIYIAERLKDSKTQRLKDSKTHGMEPDPKCAQCPSHLSLLGIEFEPSPTGS